MSTSIIVDVDPWGEGPDWIYVVIHRATGVRYEQQYGGTSCLQGEPEGYLVPVLARGARQLLDDIFVRELQGIGLGSPGSPVRTRELIDRLRAIVESIVIAVSATAFWPLGTGWPTTLKLNDACLDEMDEAWIPVLTPDGPGTLIWPNSD